MHSHLIAPQLFINNNKKKKVNNAHKSTCATMRLSSSLNKVAAYTKNMAVISLSSGAREPRDTAKDAGRIFIPFRIFMCALVPF